MVAEIKGFVEVIQDNSVSGWCYLPQSEDPLIVYLYVDDIFIRSRRADNDRLDIQRGGGPVLSGFNFRISPQLLALLPAGGRVTVLVGPDKVQLPVLRDKPDTINGGAGDGGAELKSLLADKMHIDHWGNLHVAFSKEPGKIERLLDFYCNVRAVYRALNDTDLYLTGGNLLGLIREFAFLPHDDDVDAAFCIRANSAEEAADRFFEHFEEMAPKLEVLGFGVIIENVGQYHVFKRPNHGLDIFLAWLTDDGRWYRYTGAGGPFGAKEFRLREMDYLGRRVLVPQYAETELLLTYGAGWKEPDPHFYWKRSSEVDEVMKAFEAAGRERVIELQKRYGASHG